MAKKHAFRRWCDARDRILIVGSAALLTATAIAVELTIAPRKVHAYVALMAGQQARPLNGHFNSVPVLHSNQPEEVEGPGILINTAPGTSYSAENGQNLQNPEFTFNGDFGIHLHHKYFPPYRAQIVQGARRSEITLGLILINPGLQPVHLHFTSGAIRNSFEAPYLANSLTGVRPLGHRPWNTGPGDATAVQMLRGRLDQRLSDDVTIPARSRIVLFSKVLPALGIANALLRGRSDGPFQMAVVAASNPDSDADLLAILDQGQLAPGRVYLNRIQEIQNRQIFSRVGGVALGDSYVASVSHNLELNGPLHVPLTSTERHNFGTKDVQINPLASRMIDSSLDNVGTYGVRFDLDLNLRGEGSYELVLSHPTPTGGRPFTAFRGSLQIQTKDGTQELHVVLRSGQSLPLATLNLPAGVDYPVRLSLVYPADATPGHLLSVVPSAQLARVQRQEQQLDLAKAQAERAARLKASLAKSKSAGKSRLSVADQGPDPIPPLPSVVADQQPHNPGLQQPPVPPPLVPAITVPPLTFPGDPGPAVLPPPQVNQSLVDRYQQALEAQQDIMRGLMSR